MNLQEKKAKYLQLLEEKKYHMRCLLGLSGQLEQLRYEIREVEPDWIVSAKDGRTT